MNDMITDIMEEKPGVAVTVNGDKVYRLSWDAFKERPLTKGEALDLEAFEQWLLPRQYPQALNKAVAFLAVRARSGQEVRKKLETKGYMDETIDMVLFKLEKEHILDDVAFAQDFAKARAHRQLGKSRILMELRQKGISREIAEQAVSELDAEETDSQAEALALKLLRRYEKEPDPRKAMQKVLAAMARRGYGYGPASKAVEAALKELQ